jgi:hypothetical protein
MYVLSLPLTLLILNKQPILIKISIHDTHIIQQISANVSSSGIYFYIYGPNYCSVFVPGRVFVPNYCSVFVPGRDIYCANYCSVFVPGILVQKLNNNSHNKCKSKSPLHHTGDTHARSSATIIFFIPTLFLNIP